MPGQTPWFERWPDLLAWELGRFDARGLEAAIDPAARAAGRLVVETKVDYDGEPVAVRVVYPSEYPELPPVVFGEPGLLDRHQHLFTGNFCLLEREFDDWRARDWGAADLVAEQLDRLLADTAAGPDAVRAAEAPIPEPVSAYYGYAKDCAVLVPDSVEPLAGEGGELRLRRVTDHLYVVEASATASAPSELLDLFPTASTHSGTWIRIDAPPSTPHGTGPEVATWVRENAPSALARELPRKLRRNARVPQPPSLEFVALVFPEEGPGVGETRDAYLFLCVDRRGTETHEYLIHAQPLAQAERNRRIPELHGLSARRVVVLGGGSLGADIAIELVKAGVGEIDIVDFDRFEVTNTVRHPLTIDYSGLPKTLAVATACRRANPFCVARGHELRFGDSSWTEGSSGLDRYAALVDAADLVVDATGSHQIAQFASRICAEAEMPFVAAWLTEGSYGAEIVRILPGRTCCWTCFATDHRDGQLLRAEAGPPSQVVVQGCGQPTTSGAGFDAAEAAAATTRLIVQTLAPDGGYPPSAWDHAAISFRRLPDDPHTPRFAVEILAPTTDCEPCRAPAGLTAAR